MEAKLDPKDKENEIKAMSRKEIDKSKNKNSNAKLHPTTHFIMHKI